MRASCFGPSCLSFLPLFHAISFQPSSLSTNIARCNNHCPTPPCDARVTTWCTRRLRLFFTSLPSRLSLPRLLIPLVLRYQGTSQITEPSCISRTTPTTIDQIL